VSVKGKLIKALDITIADLDEDRLVDILLDSYRQKNGRIRQLEGENAAERERLHQGLECIRRERERLHNDPLYGAAGEYFFEIAPRGKSPRQFFCVRVHGHRIDAFEHRESYDYAMRQMDRSEWK
jgi:hypothetical protein